MEVYGKTPWAPDSETLVSASLPPAKPVSCYEGHIGAEMVTGTDDDGGHQSQGPGHLQIETCIIVSMPAKCPNLSVNCPREDPTLNYRMLSRGTAQQLLLAVSHLWYYTGANKAWSRICRFSHPKGKEDLRCTAHA